MSLTRTTRMYATLRFAAGNLPRGGYEDGEKRSALLALRLKKKRIIAETGAGQHGVATAAACALLNLECIVYMGAVDCERQKLNCFRMTEMGATVVPVQSGSRTLKAAVNEALRDWVTNIRTTHYIIGSAVGRAAAFFFACAPSGETPRPRHPILKVA
mgnify:CR=1 FL=1